MVENLIEVFYHANLEGNWLFWLRTHSLLQGPETGKFSSYVLSVIRNETLLPTSSLRFEVGVFFSVFLSLQRKIFLNSSLLLIYHRPK
jgi:hypothetical protein